MYDIHSGHTQPLCFQQHISTHVKNKWIQQNVNTFVTNGANKMGTNNSIGEILNIQYNLFTYSNVFGIVVRALV